MNLPPEIKSAEDYAQELQQVTLTNKSYGKHLQMTNQRDIAIWNAAIEKAVETSRRQDPAHDVDNLNSMMQQRITQAILNLKQKE